MRDTLLDERDPNLRKPLVNVENPRPTRGRGFRVVEVAGIEPAS